jgi:hypothetical protein
MKKREVFLAYFPDATSDTDTFRIVKILTDGEAHAAFDEKVPHVPIAPGDRIDFKLDDPSAGRLKITVIESAHFELTDDEKAHGKKGGSSLTIDVKKKEGSPALMALFAEGNTDRTAITRFECQLLGVNDEVLADSAGGGEMVPDRG